MKKLLMLLACLSIAFMSCEGYLPTNPDDTEQGENNGNNGDGEGEGSENNGGNGTGNGTGTENGGDNGENGDNGGSGDSGDNGENGDNGGNGGNGDYNGGGSGSDLNFDNSPLPLDPNPVVPVKQKEQIENTLRAVMDELPAEDYRDLVELARAFYDFGEEHFDNENYEYDMSALENAWEDDLYSKIYQEGENMLGIYEYFIRISECKGTATFYSNYADYTESDDAKIVVKDVDGKDWVITVQPTQWQKNLYIGTIDDESLYADVPTEINAKMTIGSKTYADITLKLKYNISSGGLDPEKDNISVTSTINIDDIGLTIENTGYNANTGDAAVKFTFKKGSKTILDINTAANATIRYDSNYEPSSYDIKGASFVVNLMGEVQVIGNVNDAQKLIDDIYNEHLEFYGSQSDVKNAVDAINQRANVCVSFNGGQTAQAMVVADYFEDEDSEYYAAPVLVFSDNSRYGFIEFFEEHIEDSIDGWENEFEDFLESYMDLVEECFDGALSQDVPAVIG